MKILVLAAAMLLPAEAQGAELAPADRAALHALAAEMDAAWTAGDAGANARLFDEAASARFGSEPLGEGQEMIRAQFEGFFQDRPAGLRHVTSIERAEQLAPGLALWDAEVRVEGRGEGGAFEVLTTIRNLTIAVRTPAGWRVKAVRAFPVR